MVSQTHVFNEHVDQNVQKRLLPNHNMSSDVFVDRTNVSHMSFNRSSSERTINVNNIEQSLDVCLPDNQRMCDEVATHIEDELPSQSHQVECVIVITTMLSFKCFIFMK
ncbi:unnamed protein product [Cuscuta epithymum]|uniref:Uncharacterized protein n=1 Tax=Cuscuta epithymum TaxID=186058 RepID=A0AAV0G210_9ASTE|nr:unnamed protein product [Cuscuta epithymum]